MTALELAQQAKRAKPHVRYAASVDGSTVFGWSTEHGRWQRVAGLMLDGRWMSLEYELLINGEPLPDLEKVEVELS